MFILMVFGVCSSEVLAQWGFSAQQKEKPAKGEAVKEPEPAKEPKLVRKQVAVIEMMDKFRETGSGFTLTETEVTPIPEERFLWSVAKLMTARCAQLVANPPSDEAVIREDHDAVRYYLKRAKMISADKEIIEYYEGMDEVFQISQKLIDNLDDNKFYSDQKLQESNSNIGINSLEKGFHTASSNFARMGPLTSIGSGGLVAGWSYLTDAYRAKQRAENDVRAENRLAFRDAIRAFQKITPGMEALARGLDTKFRWEKYIGAADPARDRKKAWENQDFAMMFVLLVSDVYGEKPVSADAFADCVYLAMLVPHNKVYDEFRALVLAIAYDALIQQENYSLTYPVNCLKLCLCFTDDPNGGLRQQLMFCLVGEDKFLEAISLAGEIKTLRENDLDFCWVLAGVLAELEEFDVAMDWFRQMVKNAEDVSSLRTEPIFIKLRNARQKEYLEAIEPKWSWSKTIGWQYDEFTMTNKSPFPLHDVSFTVTLSDGSKTWDRTFQADRITPYRSVTWNTFWGGHSTVRYPTSSTATMNCRQHGNIFQLNSTTRALDDPFSNTK